MELWHLDIIGGIQLDDGGEAMVVTSVNDHSRFCVAAVVRRATGRAVCLAFAEALQRFGVPEVLTDNGKQFTARFGRKLQSRPPPAGGRGRSAATPHRPARVRSAPPAHRPFLPVDPSPASHRAPPHSHRLPDTLQAEQDNGKVNQWFQILTHDKMTHSLGLRLHCPPWAHKKAGPVLRRRISSLIIAVIVGPLALLVPAAPAHAADVAHNTRSIYLTAWPSNWNATACMERRIYLSPGYYDWGVHQADSLGQPGYYRAKMIGLGNGWYTWKHCIDPGDGTYTHQSWLDPDNPDWATASFSSPGWRIPAGTYTIGGFLDPREGTPSPAYPDKPFSFGRTPYTSFAGWSIAPTATSNLDDMGVGCRSSNWVNLHVTWKTSQWTSSSVYVHALVIHLMPGQSMTVSGGLFSATLRYPYYAEVTTEGHQIVYTINRTVPLNNGEVRFTQFYTPGYTGTEPALCVGEQHVDFYLRGV